tara:strand:- start:435 stop:776 length:342 start_codon:yes stop_codon:yes gene_type:complete
MTLFELTECLECAREFETSITDHSYHIQNQNRTIVEYLPDHDKCDFCKGDETCSEDGCNDQATVLDTEGNELYCSPHYEEQRKGTDCTIEEHEEFAKRIDPSLVFEPKGTKDV